MYYHPSILPASTNDRAFNNKALKTFRAIADVWFAGIERQRVVHAKAAEDFRSAQLENARKLSDSQDSADFAIHLCAFAASEPLKVIAVISELGAIAIDTHRQAIQLIELHTEDLRKVRAILGPESDATKVRADKPGSTSRKQQMTA